MTQDTTYIFIRIIVVILVEVALYWFQHWNR